MAIITKQVLFGSHFIPSPPPKATTKTIDLLEELKQDRDENFKVSKLPYYETMVERK